jgi:IS5 family transposase
VELLSQVTEQDVERLDDDTYRIAKGTAPGRIISTSDPEARHGRKSASKVIHGFKTHVTGTIESQFVTGITITDAATHDGEPTSALIAQMATHGVKPTELVGDNAYGAGANIRASSEVGVQIRTKPSRPAPRGAISKREFDIDIERKLVTCPAGKTTAEYTWVGATEETGPVPQFRFASEDCQACHLRSTCSSATAKGGRRVIRLSPYESELQQNRAFAESSRGQDVLRSRSSIERLISHLVRMGMRHARFFSVKRVQLQAFLVAAAYNMQRLFTLRAGAATDH